MNNTQSNKNELSYDTKTIIVIALLIVVYPIGVILMNRWMNWGKAIKVILTFPLVLGLIMFFVVVIGTAVSTVNYKGQIEKSAQQSSERLDQAVRENCQVKCEAQLSLITKAADKAKFNMDTCVTNCLAE